MDCAGHKVPDNGVKVNKAYVSEVRTLALGLPYLGRVE